MALQLPDQPTWADLEVAASNKMVNAKHVQMKVRQLQFFKANYYYTRPLLVEVRG